MAVNVNTNVVAMHGQHRLSRVTDRHATSMERLSSGFKINTAKDDAAGLQISNRMLSQSRGMEVAIRNANDGISMLQTAEGAMNEYTEGLVRMRDLTLRYANGSLSSDDRIAIQQEYDALKDELNRITETTSFAGQRLLNGQNNVRSYQIGSDTGESLLLSFPDLSSLRAKDRPDGVPDTINFYEVKKDWVSKPGDTFIIGNTKDRNEPDPVIELDPGSTLYDLADEINDKYGDKMGVFIDDSFNKYTDIPDPDYRGGKEITGLRLMYFTRSQGSTGRYRSGLDNYYPVYSGEGNDPATHRIGGGLNKTQDMMYYKELPSLDTTSHNMVIEQLDALLQYTDSERAKLGAAQNRLSHAINNLSQSSENVAASTSQIRDTDFAKETSELTKQSILKEVNTSMLAQASKTPQGALGLLG